MRQVIHRALHPEEDKTDVSAMLDDAVRDLNNVVAQLRSETSQKEPAHDRHNPDT